MKNVPIQRDLLRAIELAAVVYEKPGEFTENDLSEILGMSVQTIRRDAEKLRAMGIPIHSTKKYYRIDKIRLKELNELICIYLSLNKFDTIKNLKTIRNVLGVRILNVFVKILKAIEESKILKIIYGKDEKGNDIVKTVTPLSINRQGRNVYLIGLENDNPEKIRVFIFERIKTIDFINKRSAVKSIPDLYSYFSHSWGMYATGKQYDVELKFTKDKGEELKGKIYMEDQDFTDYGDCYILKMRLNLSYEFVSWVMGWGGDVEVIKPKELKNIIIDKAQEIVTFYKSL